MKGAAFTTLGARRVNDKHPDGREAGAMAVTLRGAADLAAAAPRLLLRSRR